MSGHDESVDAGEDRIEEAAYWWLILQETPERELSGALRSAWDRWQSDPENGSCLERVSGIACHVRNAHRPPAPTAGELARDRFTGDIPVEAWLRPTHRQARARGRAGFFSRGTPPTRGSFNPDRTAGSVARVPGRPWALAGPGLLVLLAVAWGLTQWPRVPALWEALTSNDSHYSTQSGEHRQILLPDGSTVALGASTELVVRYAKRLRTVVVGRGVAIFNVEHDPARPFIVEAGASTVTAVGTAFQVLQDEQRTVVTVTEGTVLVAPREQAAVSAGSNRASGERAAAVSWLPARVSRGEEITIDPAARDATIVTGVDTEIATAWREGRLRYLDAELHDVIADVNRYSPRRLTCEGSACGLLYTGTVFEKNVDAWIASLPRIFPVEVAQTDAENIIIRPR